MYGTAKPAFVAPGQWFLYTMPPSLEEPNPKKFCVVKKVLNNEHGRHAFADVTFIDGYGAFTRSTLPISWFFHDETEYIGRDRLKESDFAEDVWEQRLTDDTFYVDDASSISRYVELWYDMSCVRHIVCFEPGKRQVWTFRPYDLRTDLTTYKKGWHIVGREGGMGKLIEPVETAVSFEQYIIP